MLSVIVTSSHPEGRASRIRSGTHPGMAQMGRRSFMSRTTRGMGSAPGGNEGERSYGKSRFMRRGKGMNSRMWCFPVIHATVRSTPSPKPEWGKEP